MTLTLIVRKLKLCSNYLSKFSINLDGILYEPHTHSILSDEYSRDRNLLMGVRLHDVLVVFFLDRYRSPQGEKSLV